MSPSDRKRKQSSEVIEVPRPGKPSPPEGRLLEKPFPRQSLAPETRASDNALSYHPSLVEAVVSKSLLKKPYLSTSKIPEYSALPKATAANAQASENLLPSTPYVTNAGISELPTLQKPSAADAQAFRNHLPRRHQQKKAHNSAKPTQKR